MTNTYFLPFPNLDVDLCLHSLKSDSPPLWGMMRGQHMVEHLMFPLKISVGDLDVGIHTPPDKVEKTKALFLMSDLPLRKEFKSPVLDPDKPMPLEYAGMPEAIVALKQHMVKFITYWEKHPKATHPHPVFGLLNLQEWIWFHRKHFTHHFSQFGLL